MSNQAVAWAISHNAGSGGAKAALLSIANYANEYGECWASQATIAQGANCCVRQLRRILADLESSGLIERERRGGTGRGRDTDLIRLRMRELPVVITAKRREEQPAIIAASPKTQPDTMSASQGATGQNVRGQPDKMSASQGATGQNVRGQPDKMSGGNRTMMSDNNNNNNNSLSNERESPSRAFVASMRKHMSAAGNQRTKPKLCDKALAPLIKRYGFDALLAAAKGFYSTPQAIKDGGEFQPGLQVIAADGRLEALVQSGGVSPEERERRLMLFAFDQTWSDDWGPRPDASQPPDLITLAGGKP